MKKHLITLITLAITFASTAQVPSYVPTNGLVGWWPFNGNSNDESGNGNNGIANGAVLTTDRFGLANKAYSFDGNGDNILVQNSNSLNSTALTINVWIYAFIDNIAILEKGDVTNASKHGYALTHNDIWQIPRGLKSSFGDGNCTGPTNNSVWGNLNSVSNNNWSMITVSIDFSGNVKHYLNGNLIFTSTSQLITCNDPLSTLRFGGPHWNNDPEWFNGYIDDIGIWNRALTQCEIQDLYNAELNSLSVNGGPDQEVCEGQSTSLYGTGASAYSWSNNVVNGVGFVPTATTSYILTGTDANGCIGTDTVNVVVNGASSSSQTQTALDSFTWPVNGQTYTQSGTYSDTLVNVAGCDSIVSLNLTMSYTGIEELNPSSSKKLLRITDLSGKETPFRKNTVLLFIYEDGMVERVFVGE
jgi:hypothetical protein